MTKACGLTWPVEELWLQSRMNALFWSKTDLLTLKEFVETGKVRPHPYNMPVNLWSPPKEAAA
jgi:hypothetical protein